MEATKPEYLPVHHGEITQQFGPYFRIPGDTEIGVESLLHMYFPDWLLEQMVECTSAYADSRLTYKKHQKKIDELDILLFIAALYYMMGGVVRMPSKSDYFPQGINRSQNQEDHVYLPVEELSYAKEAQHFHFS
jgi:hypothetical protein